MPPRRPRPRPHLLPGHLWRAGQQLAVGIGAEHAEHRDLGERAGSGHAPVPAAIDLARLLQLLQHRFQRNPIGTLDAEGPGDLALADGDLRAADELEDLLARGKSGPLAPALAHA